MPLGAINIASLRIGVRTYKVVPHPSHILSSGSHACSENVLAKGSVVCVQVQ